MTAATLEHIKTFPYRPAKGRRFLSVNLALVDLTELTEIAAHLGFKPALIQIQGRSGTQVHALLWEGEIADTPSDMDEKVDYLADRINTDAIRYSTGAWTHKAA
jgi:hypothetical protein